MGVFDLGHQHKCPKCGKSMDYMYGKLLCSACGYMAEYQVDIKAGTAVVGNEQLSRKGKSQIERDKEAEKEVVRKPVQSKYADRYKEDAYRMEETVARTTRKSSRNMVHNKLAGIMLVGAFFVVFVCYLFRGIGNKTSYQQVGVDDKEEVVITEEVGSIIPTRKEQSVGMVELVEKMFGKTYEKVTENDYARIVYISFHIYDDVGVTYKIMPQNGNGYGEYVDLELESHDFNHCDFSAFSKLNTLYMNEGTMVNLYNLKELSVLGTSHTPSEIAACANPEQFISMTFYDLEEADSLKGISAFENLTTLYLYADGLEDISELASLESLNSLGVYFADYVTDFSVLQEMKSVEYLTISSYSLNNFEFVEHMPRLMDLQIEDSFYADATQWEYIVNSPSICSLGINNCVVPYGVENFWSMSNLEYFSMIDCEAGIRIDAIPYNESIEQMYISGTNLVDMSSSEYNPNGKRVDLKSYKKELKKAYPNMREITCE